MRFEVILNMPVRGDPDSSRPPALIHRLVVDHSATCLEEFCEALMKYDFIIVEEFFPSKFNKEYESHGPIAINHHYIGKVKEWDRK